ncbi:fibroin heavy chain-like [Prinia subflava]|uniref:fibroin heavy chain-like n=1 Tax=Prinia subflava TaxID=208062 RepID=UPI002FE1C8FC
MGARLEWGWVRAETGMGAGLERGWNGAGAGLSAGMGAGLREGLEREWERGWTGPGAGLGAGLDAGLERAGSGAGTALDAGLERAGSGAGTALDAGLDLAGPLRSEQGRGRSRVPVQALTRDGAGERRWPQRDRAEVSRENAQPGGTPAWACQEKCVTLGRTLLCIRPQAGCSSGADDHQMWPELR